MAAPATLVVVAGIVATANPAAVGTAAMAAPTAAGTAMTAAPAAAGAMATVTAPTAAGAAQWQQWEQEGVEGAYTAPGITFFILYFAVNLHLYLLSGFNVPIKLAQCYAKSLGLTAQLRLSKSWAEAF
jgi:hypothetical protein